MILVLESAYLPQKIIHNLKLINNSIIVSDCNVRKILSRFPSSKLIHQRQAKVLEVLRHKASIIVMHSLCFQRYCVPCVLYTYSFISNHSCFIIVWYLFLVRMQFTFLRIFGHAYLESIPRQQLIFDVNTVGVYFYIHLLKSC